MNRTGDAEPVFGFIIVDGVPSYHYGAGLGDFLLPAAENGQQYFRIETAHRKSDNIHGCQRFAAHGIHVAETVRRGYLPEQIGIVHNRSEKIQGLDQRRFLVQQINTGIIRGIDPDENPGIMNRRQFGKHVG